MAKHYEALQKAEAERKRKATGQTAPVAPVEWDTTPQTAARTRRGASGLLRLFKREAEPQGANSSAEINKRRISLLQPDSFVAEQFRTLRGRIDSLATQRPIKTIAITSASEGEGKSTAAINLAAVTAMSVGRQVLLLDCDMRRPTLHTSLGIEPNAGLAEVLLDQASIEDAVHKVEGLNMDLLPVRSRPSNPSELLGSAQMRSLIEEVASRYDRVIIDTAPTLGLPDTKIVSELCDGLVIVVRAGVTPRTDVEAALEVLDRRRVLGVLLNGTSEEQQSYRD